MVYESFKHVDPDAFHDNEITLHDCTADKISFENGVLLFYLPDGFWVTPHHKDNTFGKIVRTDASVVSFCVEDINDIIVRVFTKNTWCRRQKARVEYLHMNELIDAVNSGKRTLEFITQYRSYNEQMWHCVIHSKKKPYYAECQIHLPETDATFLWNELRPDRAW